MCRQVTAAEIEETRIRYSPAAKRGAILFFVIASLSAITNMYEYSLASFLVVFNGSLHNSRRDASIEGRLRNIIDTLTYDVYAYTCLGLFERHKLMLSFQVRPLCRSLAGPPPGRRKYSGSGTAVEGMWHAAEHTGTWFMILVYRLCVMVPRR